MNSLLKKSVHRVAAVLGASALLLSLAGPVSAATSVRDLQAGLKVFQANGNSNPFLSVGPEVGWNAGLEGVRPLGSPLYRMWDMKVAWRDVNPAPGVFDWSILDRRMALVESWGGRALMVLGLTPQWAAANPNAGDPRWGAGTASPPADMNTWREYVRALVTRYGDRIGAYETWNEANLSTFFTGSPAHMAEMLSIAHEEITARSSALVLAPSVTTRLASGARFTQAMLSALGEDAANKMDGFTIHTYPKGSAGATYKDNCTITTSPFDCIESLDPKAAARERFNDIREWQTAVVETVGPDSPLLKKALWDTEVNYGLAGPGINPPVDWSDADGAALISYSYADSKKLGIDATFWYEFTAAPYDLLGVQLTPQTPQTQAAYFALPSTPTGTSGGDAGLISYRGCVLSNVELICPRANLRGVNLAQQNYLGIDLDRASLSGADLSKTNFQSSVFTDSTLLNANLRDVNAVNADWRGVDLSDADLRNANLANIDLRKANLTGADLRGANLTGADLRGATMNTTDFRAADLRRAFLGGSQNRGANFRGADLRGARIYTDFRRSANLAGARQ